MLSHITHHGWQSYWTSEESIIRRLEWATKYYKDRWQQFILDTSKPHKYWERRDYGFSIGLRYLVRFLMMVGQNALAEGYTETLVELLVDEVSDQPIENVEWLQ